MCETRDQSERVQELEGEVSDLQSDLEDARAERDTLQEKVTDLEEQAKRAVRILNDLSVDLDV